MSTGFFQYFDSVTGQIVRGFTDACGMEERAALAEAEYRYQLELAEEERRNTPLHDPNTCDTRRVRKEFHEPRMVNLGYRANKVIAGRSRRL